MRLAPGVSPRRSRTVAATPVGPWSRWRPSLAGGGAAPPLVCPKQAAAAGAALPRVGRAQGQGTARPLALRAAGILGSALTAVGATARAGAGAGARAGAR